jgi:hypothetical protein
MNKVFFVALAFSSCMYASEQSSPSQGIRTIKTSVSAGSLKKNDFTKIDIDEIFESTKSKKSDSPVVRVRKQSFDNHDDFIKAEKMTEAAFHRNRSETK